MSFKKNIIKECIASDKNTNESLSYEKIKEIADHILASTKHRPQIAIVCGSGLGGLADKLVNSEVLPFESVPNFPVTTISGHAGKFVLGRLSNVPVLCLQGRIHFYEGHPMWKVTLYVRVLKLMGIKDLIVTNAAGGLNPAYKTGDIMLLKDHLNMHNLGGETPLREFNDFKFGPQFLSMVNAYDKDLRLKAKKFVSEAGLEGLVHEGVFTMATGPMFETPSELRVLRILGADAVGMSTIPEVIVARHCGMRVFAFSLITNICITDFDTTVDTHADVLKVGSSRQKEVHDLVSYVVQEMSHHSTSASSS